MIRLSKIILFFTAVVLLAWLLPWTYRFLTVRPDRTPFTLYSCVTESFASIDFNDGEIVRHDASGKTYTDREFDSILPLFYYRQLLSDGRQPDTLRGVALTPQTVSMQSFYFRNSPSDINKVKPELYPLLEAMSGRVELQMPPDVFRIHDRIEFIDMATNRVNDRKSDLFTRALQAKGFEFPAACVSGNPTTRKEYDEGYMLLDGKGGLYHFKQLRGRPYVRRVDLPDSVRIADIFITEFSNRRSYAFLSDEAHNFYVLTNPGYELKQLPVGHFDPRSENIMIVADLFNWTVSISGEEGTRYYAVDADDYSLCDTLAYPAAEGVRQRVAEWLFPFDLSFTSYDDQYVYPRLGRFSACALLLNVLLAVAYLIVRRRHLRCAWLPAAGIVLLGLFLFVPLMVIRR